MKKPASDKKTDGRLENSEASQAALRAAGRKLFGKHGYEGSSVGALCAEARLTSGALYHHFGDKKGLFAAVAEELDSQLVEIAGSAGARAMAAGHGAWESFMASIDALLQAGADPAGRRIGLVDAPAVLGGDAWLAIRERHGLGAMTAALAFLQAQGVIDAGDPRRLARLVLGLLYGAIEAMPAASGSQDSCLAPTRQLVHSMLGGLRREP